MPEFRIVPETSQVWIAARSSVHPVNGRATAMRGHVEVDVEDGRLGDTFSGRLEVPVADLRSGNKLYDRELQRRVDARRYPLITGEVRTAERVDEAGMYRVDGDVTFHGVTRPVSGDVALALDDGRLLVEGRHVFDIREYGIKPPRILMLQVYPDVTVQIRLVGEAAV